MRKFIILSILLIFLVSFISAETTLTIIQQPNELYNMGEAIYVPVTISTTTGIPLQNLKMNLLCSGNESNFYNGYVGPLQMGGEETVDAKAPATMNGNCVIKAVLENNEPTLTNEFRISNIINVEIISTLSDFNPGEQITIEGEALRETGESVNGFVDLIVTSENSSFNQTHQGTVRNGFFSVSFSLSEKAVAGGYFIKAKVYEKDGSGSITNNGIANHRINIKQIPTNLEIVFEEDEVEPGTNLNLKAVLHDQTGKNIESTAILTVKDSKNKILQQTEIATDEFLEFPILYNDPPEEWTVVGVSNQLTAESSFKIMKKEEVKAEIINKTLSITNAGNVPYNKTLLVKIGETSMNVKVFLGVDESKKYVLTAPDGEYNIEIIEDGESTTSESVFLTGKAIDIKEAGNFGFLNYPLAWIFVIAILGIIAFLVAKKGYKKSFFGYITNRKKGEEREEIPVRKDSKLKARNRAEISLSLKGEKQKTTVLCLKIKNLKDIEKEKGNIEETLQEIINIVEENKGAVYENYDNMFFIFAPQMTKTFKNEKTVLDISQKIKAILENHNKRFKHKIDFGMSINEGDVITNKDRESLKFMSFGSLMTNLKKLASISHNNVLLSEKIKGKLHSVKTEKHHRNGVDYYSIKEIRGEKDEEQKKFISNFLKRLEKND